MKLGHDVLLLTEPGKPLEQAKKLGIPYNDEIRLNSRNVFDYLKTFKNEIVVIAPKTELPVSRADKNPTHLQACYELGREAAVENLRQKP